MARLPRSRRARVVVFVLTVVVVVVASAAGPLTAYQPAPDVDTSEYEVSGLVPERAPAEGDVSVRPVRDPGVVLVDLAHANRFDTHEIQPLLAAITATGADVELLHARDDFDAELSRADALLVIDPGDRYTAAEVDRVERFVDAGGRLAMLGEPTRSEIQATAFFATIAPLRNRLAPLSTRFGFEFGEGFLYNMKRGHRDGNYRNVLAEAAGDSPLLDGVDRTAMYTATSVHPRDGEPLLVSVDATRSSRGDATGEYPLAAVDGDGDVLAIGDTTFIMRDNYNVLDNDRLLANLARFLVTGDRTRALAEYPAFLGEEPTVRYTSPELLGAAQTVGLHLKRTGRDPTLSLETETVFARETDVLVTTYGFLEEHDVRNTGVDVEGGTVSVDGYESDTDGVAVIRAPRKGVDLLVVADTPLEVSNAASNVVLGHADRFAITNRTVVIQ